MLQAKITLVKTKAPNSTQQTSNPFWLGKQLNKQKNRLSCQIFIAYFQRFA